VVFLTLTEHQADGQSAQVQFVRPSEVRKGHVFKVLIHLDVVEDLLFYHHPREELIEDGKMPWRQFQWQYGRPDGDSVLEDPLPPTRFCSTMEDPCWRRQNDDEDRDHSRRKARGLIRRVSHWMDTRGRSKNRSADRSSGNAWYSREASHGRNLRNFSPPPSQERDAPEEKRATHKLWRAKSLDSDHADRAVSFTTAPQLVPEEQMQQCQSLWQDAEPKNFRPSDAIVISPSHSFVEQRVRAGSELLPTQSDAIVIRPQTQLSIQNQLPHIGSQTQPSTAAPPVQENAPVGSISQKKSVDKQISRRKSPRLHEQTSKGKTIIKKAQELVAKKCGILGEEQEMDSTTLQQYVNMYKHPLSGQTIEAISKFSEITEDKKRRKRKRRRSRRRYSARACLCLLTVPILTVNPWQESFFG
jgi:hypothetical protein